MKRPMPLLQKSLAFFTLLAVTVVCISDGVAAPKRAIPAKKPVASAASPVVYNTVASTELLKDPKHYLNKDVQLDGVFNTFGTVGLDYKKAFRDSRDYVTLIIYRPDVLNHTIPMAELKLIYPRKKSDAVEKMEAGDKIRVKGRVFSTALNEPWLDVSEVTILEKTKTTQKKDDES